MARTVPVEAVSVCDMSLPEAFSDLMEVSSQVQAAIVLEGNEVLASSLGDERRADELAAAVRRLAEAAQRTRPGLRQMEVALPEGNVLLVREGGRLIGATTNPDPPSGLVFYDLRACLSGLGAESEARSNAR